MKKDEKAFDFWFVKAIGNVVKQAETIGFLSKDKKTEIMLKSIEVLGNLAKEQKILPYGD